MTNSNKIYVYVQNDAYLWNELLSNIDIFSFMKLPNKSSFFFDVDTNVLICLTILFADLLLSSNKQLRLEINLEEKIECLFSHLNIMCNKSVTCFRLGYIPKFEDV